MKKMRFFTACYGGFLLLNVLWMAKRNTWSPFVQLIFAVSAIALFCVGAVLHRQSAESPLKKKQIAQCALGVLFGYYVLIISAMLIFGGIFLLNRSGGGAVNLVPFHTISAYLRSFYRTGNLYSLANLLGNVIVFAPMGFFLPLLFPKMQKWRLFVPVISCMVFSVELLQYVTLTGSADIDDFFLNVAGRFWFFSL